MLKSEIENVEYQLLLEAILQIYGFDFRQYAKASLMRRVRKGMSEAGYTRISDLIPNIIHDRAFFESFFLHLSVNVSEMFRDPMFFKSLREDIVPYLKTYPYLKIWIAGCAGGEEVYSLCILLKEEEIYDQCLIYATDFNDLILDKAQSGIYPLENVKNYTLNYQKSGGRESFGNYYHADNESVILNRTLKERVTFANHNLATDDVFGEMNLIICRNVLIYFNKDLQDKVLRTFYNSLCYNGFLCLGSKESIRFSNVEADFQCLDQQVKIFQKKPYASYLASMTAKE